MQAHQFSARRQRIIGYFLPSHHRRLISNQIYLKQTAKALLKVRESFHTCSKIHLNYHLTGVDSSILYQNTRVNSDNSGASEKSFRITPAPPPLLGTLTLNKSSCEICILRQISRKNLIFAFSSLQLFLLCSRLIPGPLSPDT